MSTFDPKTLAEYMKGAFEQTSLSMGLLSEVLKAIPAPLLSFDRLMVNPADAFRIQTAGLRDAAAGKEWTYRMEIVPMRVSPFVPEGHVLAITDEVRHSISKEIEKRLLGQLDNWVFSHDPLRCVTYYAPPAFVSPGPPKRHWPIEIRRKQRASWHRLSRREKRRALKRAARRRH